MRSTPGSFPDFRKLAAVTRALTPFSQRLATRTCAPVPRTAAT